MTHSVVVTKENFLDSVQSLIYIKVLTKAERRGGPSQSTGCPAGAILEGLMPGKLRCWCRGNLGAGAGETQVLAPRKLYYSLRS